jgi:hypothetical protein
MSYRIIGDNAESLDLSISGYEFIVTALRSGELALLSLSRVRH